MQPALLLRTFDSPSEPKALSVERKERERHILSGQELAETFVETLNLLLLRDLSYISVWFCTYVLLVSFYRQLTIPQNLSTTFLWVLWRIATIKPKFTGRLRFFSAATHKQLFPTDVNDKSIVPSKRSDFNNQILVSGVILCLPLLRSRITDRAKKLSQ
jgi:hypothetical protein